MVLVKDKPADQAVEQQPGRVIAGIRVTKRRAILALIALAVLGFIAWKVFGGPSLPAGFAAGNGRLEATQLYVSTKYPGRVKTVLVDEGDTVEPGQVVARMDTEALEAQLREALAKLQEAKDNRDVATANVSTRQSEVAVKQADYEYADLQFRRSKGLVGKGAVSEQEAEIDNARMLSSRAQVAGAKADLIGSRAQTQQALSAIAAAEANAERLRAEIKDAVLVSPIRARVDTRLAEPGEVLPAGGRVFSVLDLSDVYMYVFLPNEVAGKIALGSEARIVLDAAPQYPIAAYVSFVSPTAQFTPKTVETAEERHNLTFRVKLQIPRERLRQYEALVKAGVPGMGYVRFDGGATWPADLTPRGVPANVWTPTGRAVAQ
jgi:HlyD family secretion protein